MDSPPTLAATGFPYDVFVTFAEADGPWVRDQLYKRLSDNGLVVATADTAFLPGVPLIEGIQQAIAESRYVLAVLSPAYISDRWGQYTRTAALSTDAIEGRRRFVPVVCAPCPLPREIKQLWCVNLADPPTEDTATAAAERAAHADRWRALVEHLSEFGEERAAPRIRTAVMFRRVAELAAAEPAAAAAVGEYRGRLEPEVKRTRELRQLKRIHDLLHEVLISCYRLARSAAEGYPRPNSVSDLGTYAGRLDALNATLGEVTKLASKARPPVVATWVPKLTACAVAVRDAVTLAAAHADARLGKKGDAVAAARAREQYTKWATAQPSAAALLAAHEPDYVALGQGRLKVAGKSLGDVLNQQMSRVNAELYRLAETIQLAELADTMADLRDRLPLTDAGATADLTAGIDGLRELSARKELLLELHNSWQDVDTLLVSTEKQLWREGDPVDDDPGRDLDLLSDTWQSVDPIMAPCIARTPDECRALVEHGGKLALALAERNPYHAIQAFHSYCGAATQIFYGVDKKLLWLCDALGGLGHQISRVLGE